MKGGDAAYNAQALRTVLRGEPSAYRDIVLLNAGAALLVGDHVDTLAEGVALAASVIDSGKAQDRLAQWAAFTKGETAHV